MHDLVIDNARLIDGLGTPVRDGSLAVKDGRIAALGADTRGVDRWSSATAGSRSRRELGLTTFAS